MMHFQYSSWFDAPVERLFGFHERPDAIELLTPPGQKLKVVSRSGGLEVGALVDLRVGPLQMQWLAQHTDYEKNRLFVDEQVKGPFSHWVHAHRFESENGGSRLTDDIEFAFFGGVLTGWVVKWQLGKMFRHRHQMTAAYLKSLA